MPIDRDWLKAFLSPEGPPGFQTALRVCRAVRDGALLAFLCLFAPLGAWVQYQQGDVALTAIYVVLTPVVWGFTWLAARRTFSRRG